MDALISVVVPVYNVEKYLSKCIESIIGQTYKNLEIILVNDGSTDNSEFICKNYALRDNRIKVISKENGGLSDARNIGLNNLTGNYVSFIDSDDFIHKNYFEILLKLITENKADIAQCGFKKVYENDIIELKKIDCNCLSDSKITVLNNIEALNNLYNEFCTETVIICNKLYKVELFKNIRFPIGKIHEDEFTTYKLLYNSKKLVKITEPLYYYLQRSNSITKQEFNAGHFDSLEAYSGQIHFYSKKGLLNLRKKAILTLEYFARIFMIKVLKSNIKEKEIHFDYLCKFYKNNYSLFKEIICGFNLKHIIAIMINYSPKFIVKVICTVLYLKDIIFGQLSSSSNKLEKR